MRKINLFIKRAADFLCSGLGIILLSPLLLVIALWNMPKKEATK